MAKKIVFFNGERLMSTVAVFISVMTLGVFIYQTNLIRKEQHMSVFPYLELGNSGGGSSNFEYLLMNKGIGPALISDIKIKYKGESYEGSLDDYVLSKKQKKDSFNFRYSSIYKGRFISPDETVILIANSDGDYTSAERLYDILNDSDFELIIAYESIYEERWQISNNATGVRKIK